MATKLLPRLRAVTNSIRCTPIRLSVASIPSARRTYYSADHPPPPGPFSEVESSILSKAIKHVPTHGFTLTTLGIGAKEAGYVGASVNLFEKGAWSLVHWHLWEKRMGLSKTVEELKKEEEEGKWEKLGVKGRVGELTWVRLKGNEEVLGRWQEALALSALPSNIPPTLKEVHLLADEILYLSNDTSVDSSWYSKRISLSTIYAATELFMTQDKSEGFKDTREFMERRFKDSEELGGFIGGVGQWVGFTAKSFVNVARSKGVRI